MNIEFSGLSSKRLSKSEAISQIMGIQGQIFQSGNVDTEKSDLVVILNQLKVDKISPERALELVNQLEQGRQDYH